MSSVPKFVGVSLIGTTFLLPLPLLPSLPHFTHTHTHTHTHTPSLYSRSTTLCRGKGGWQKVYTSLDNFQLKFFTDHKIAMDPATKPLGTFHLLQANVCTYTKEKKVKHSFMVSLRPFLSLPLCQFPVTAAPVVLF